MTKPTKDQERYNTIALILSDYADVLKVVGQKGLEKECRALSVWLSTTHFGPNK